MEQPGPESQADSNPYAYPGTPAPDVPFSFRADDRSATEERAYRIEFTASAGEYFRIWIVNLALTIVTLGIYSAWAKVRRNRYFYGHTLIDGEGFEYLANPIAILKGRIVAVLLFGAYSFSGHVSPVLSIVTAIVLVVAMPWLIVRSLAFNAHNSAYRNIRFAFHGTYGEPVKLIMGGGILLVLSLGLAYPYLKSRMVQYVARNHAFGETRFNTDPITGPFYRTYLKALGLMLLLFLLIGAGAGAAGAFQGSRAAFGVAMFGIIAGMYVAYLLIYAYLSAHTTNITWNAMTAGPLRFICTLSARRLAALYLVNIVAIICTVGLATPWAVVRTMRYRAANLTLMSLSDLGSFVAGEARQVNATGEEVGEMFDIDVSI